MTMDWKERIRRYPSKRTGGGLGNRGGVVGSGGWLLVWAVEIGVVAGITRYSIIINHQGSADFRPDS
jgi:hypothetical protein